MEAAQSDGHAKPVKLITLAIDDSAPSKRAAKVTARIALALGAKVEVVHFRERIYSRMGPADLEDPEMTVSLIDTVVAELKSAGVDAVGALGVTHPTAEAAHIVQAAHDSGADLIAVGTRGLSAGRAALTGSVSHDLIHSSDIPVLVVP